MNTGAFPTDEDDGEETNGAANGDLASWKPPGELLHSYKAKGKKFEIWQSSLTDPRAKEIVSNMKIFIPFFIEGGTVDFLEEPDWALERWKIFLL
jgi:histone acetyltransferase 1